MLHQPQPRGLLRALYRMPIVLYRLHLGWLAGNRFLLLTHTGRQSGLPRQSVLEVVDYDRAAHSYTVASAYGERADWYRNIRKQPEVIVQSSGFHGKMLASRLAPDEAEAALARYAHRHPLTARYMPRVLLGHRAPLTPDLMAEIANAVPFVRFTPMQA